jgi:hypothetical protein
MRLLVIEPQEEEPKKSKKRGSKVIKTRSFSAIPLCYLASPDYYGSTNSKNENIRPMFLMYGGSEAQVRAFTANLRTGRVAEIREKNGHYTNVEGKIEILKRAGYRWITQKVAGVNGANGEVTTIMTAYLPEFFSLEPALIDPDICKFMCLTPQWWIERELEVLRRDKKLIRELSDYIQIADWPTKYNMSADELIGLVPQACYYFAYLSARTKVALPGAITFQLQVYLAALKTGVGRLFQAGNEDVSSSWQWAYTLKGRNHKAHGLEKVGLPQAVITCSSQEALNQFLDQECAAYSLNQQALDKLYPERAQERVELRAKFIEDAKRIADSVRNAQLPQAPDEAPALPAPREDLLLEIPAPAPEPEEAVSPGLDLALGFLTAAASAEPEPKPPIVVTTPSKNFSSGVVQQLQIIFGVDLEEAEFGLTELNRKGRPKKPASPKKPEAPEKEKVVAA